MPIWSTKTKRSGLVAAATITCQGALKKSSLSLAPTDVFSTPPQPPHPGKSPSRSPKPRWSAVEPASLGEGCCWALLEVGFQEPPCTLNQLGLGAGALLEASALPAVGRLCGVYARRSSPPLPRRTEPRCLTTSSGCSKKPRWSAGGSLEPSRFTCKTCIFPSEPPRTRTWNLEIKSLSR